MIKKEFGKWTWHVVLALVEDVGVVEEVLVEDLVVATGEVMVEAMGMVIQEVHSKIHFGINL